MSKLCNERLLFIQKEKKKKQKAYYVLKHKERKCNSILIGLKSEKSECLENILYMVHETRMRIVKNLKMSDVTFYNQLI